MVLCRHQLPETSRVAAEFRREFYELYGFLTPKLHHQVHDEDLWRRNGPRKQYSCMRPQNKHQLWKRMARQLYWPAMLCTLAERHNMRVAYQLMMLQRGECSENILTKLHARHTVEQLVFEGHPDTGHLYTAIKQASAHNWQGEVMKVHWCKAIKLAGTFLTEHLHVMLQRAPPEFDLQFGQIKDMLIIENTEEVMLHWCVYRGGLHLVDGHQSVHLGSLCKQPELASIGDYFPAACVLHRTSAGVALVIKQ